MFYVPTVTIHPMSHTSLLQPRLDIVGVPPAPSDEFDIFADLDRDIAAKRCRHGPGTNHGSTGSTGKGCVQRASSRYAFVGEDGTEKSELASVLEEMFDTDAAGRELRGIIQDHDGDAARDRYECESGEDSWSESEGSTASTEDEHTDDGDEGPSDEGGKPPKKKKATKKKEEQEEEEEAVAGYALPNQRRSLRIESGMGASWVKKTTKEPVGRISVTATGNPTATCLVHKGAKPPCLCCLTSKADFSVETMFSDLQRWLDNGLDLSVDAHRTQSQELRRDKYKMKLQKRSCV